MKWLLGTVLLAAVLWWGWQGSASWRMVSWQKLSAASPLPSFSQSTPSPVPSPRPGPCEVITMEEINAITSSTFLPPRATLNQRQNGLLVQRCLWLASDEKLTPTITITLVTPEAAESATLQGYWEGQLQESTASARFRQPTLDGTLGAAAAYADSWGTHYQLPMAIITAQVSMPRPGENQQVEQQVLDLIVPRLSKFDSSAQTVP